MNLLRSKIILFIITIVILTGCFQRKKKKTFQSNEYIPKIVKKLNKEKDVEAKQTSKFPEFKSNLPTTFEKGIYLTAYTVATNKFYTVLDSSEVAGINAVIFDIKNMNGDIFCSVPQTDGLTGKNVNPIIDIAKVVKELHSRNMKAVSRVVMFHDQFSAGMDSLLRPFYANGNVWKESERRKPSWVDSSNPKYQEMLLNLISYVASQGVDEIQLDYIRFPTQGKIDKAVFHFQREDSLLATVDSSYVWREKEDIIVDFIKRAEVICQREEIKLTADVFAIVAWQRRADILQTGQNIVRMTKHLDSIHPMIYSSHFANNFGYRDYIPNEPYHIVYKGLKLTKKHTKKGCKVIPYLQANSWKVNYSPEYIIAQIKAVENGKADGYILWNAANNYFRTLRWLKKYYKKP